MAENCRRVSQAIRDPSESIDSLVLFATWLPPRNRVSGYDIGCLFVGWRRKRTPIGTAVADSTFAVST
jgi:hypothetical protein